MSKIFVTGDTHGDFSRFSEYCFPVQKELTKEDIVIILGDFGGIWDKKSNEEEQLTLERLNNKNFTTVFIDGNHENYDRLDAEFPIINFCGGKVHQIMPTVYHLIRGEIYNFAGFHFFAFGGAASHDIQDGILDIKDYQDNYSKMIADYRLKTILGWKLRINHISWWKQEMPSRKEMDSGINNLNKFKEIDYVLSHSLPSHILPSIGMQAESNSITNYFQNEVVPILKRKENPVKWYSGHYHLENEVVYEDNITYIVKYHDIERIV